MLRTGTITTFAGHTPVRSVPPRFSGKLRSS
jgi:hypothetical protein